MSWHPTYSVVWKIFCIFAVQWQGGSQTSPNKQNNLHYLQLLNKWTDLDNCVICKNIFKILLRLNALFAFKMELQNLSSAVIGFVYSSLMRMISNHEENVTPSNKYLMCVKYYFSIVFSKHDFSNRKVITMFCWCDCPGSFFNVLVTLVLSQYDTIFSVKFFTKYKFLATDVIKHKSHVHGTDFLVIKLWKFK